MKKSDLESAQKHLTKGICSIQRYLFNVLCLFLNTKSNPVGGA